MTLKAMVGLYSCGQSGKSKSNKYSAVLGNLKECVFLFSEEVNVLISGYLSKHMLVPNSIGNEKDRMVFKALTDNYNRLKT